MSAVERFPKRVFHLCYVQKIQGNGANPGGGYFAVCPACGMDEFPDRRTRVEAEQDGLAHTARIQRSLLDRADSEVSGRDAA